MKELKGRSVLSGESIKVKIDNGSIIGIEDLTESEGLPFISPGFIDTQFNGYAGIDYSSEKLEKKDLFKMAELLAASGTTSHFPTIITGPGEVTTKNLYTISSTLSEYPELAAAIPGIHIEGPYISSEEGARGAHDLNFIRNPDYAEFSEWQDAAEGRIRELTLAPERPGAMEFIKRLSSEDVIVSIGHTAASSELIKEAVDAGACMSTHLGNGSHGMMPRLKNYIWEQLASDSLSASIITDGYHLPSSVVKVMLRAKGLDRIILVSDVAPLGGMTPGVYKWGSINVEVFEDGHLGLAGTEYLAGAGHLLDHSLAWLMNEVGVSPGEAVSLCTSNPYLKFFPLNNVPGLNLGDPANLVLFNWEKGDQKLSILETWRAGSRVYAGNSSN